MGSQMANINFNITAENIKSNPNLGGSSLRLDPAYDPKIVNADLARLSFEVQAATANLSNHKNIVPLTAGEVKFASAAHTTIASASQGAFGLLGDLVQSALQREAKVRQP